MTENSNLDELLLIRPARPEDKPFIYSTWLRGLYYGCDWFNGIEQEYYYKHYHDALEGLFKKNHTHCSVAALEEDADVILGYSVWNETTLHWVYVKAGWRKMGIAKRLIPKDIERVTHLTKMGKIIKPTHWKFNPFAL